ncbi:MAG: DUF4388 domain-containing protein [Candidatus Krumholzibacteria bacterium]|nr:DUF4388 domain-containing protein [Candidatus Krumholzibacteria bacterium]
MALEGNVKDFGLSEIFQLIALQKKSGMLSVTADETTAIYFKDGQIISTRDRRSQLRDPFKDYLINYGFLERSEIERIESIQSETKMDLTDILIREKFFSEDELGVIYFDQIQETLQEVLNWPKSYYKFNIGNQLLQGVQSHASIKVEGVLMESMRRIDEYPELLRIFTSEKMAVKRLDMPQEKPPKLDRQEEFIYELLEEETRIETLIATAKMARFCTYEALKNLLEKGLLEIAEKPVEEKTVEVKPKTVVKKKRKPLLLPSFSVVMLLVAAFSVGEYLVPIILPPGWCAASPRDSSMTTGQGGTLLADGPEELNRRYVEAALKQGLEEHKASRGTYPISLEVLAAKEIVTRRLLDEAQHHGFTYRTVNEDLSYSLSRNQ